MTEHSTRRSVWHFMILDFYREEYYFFKQKKNKNSFNFNMTEKSKAVGLGKCHRFPLNSLSSQADHGKWNFHKRTYHPRGLKKQSNLALCPPRPISIPIQNPENHHHCYCKSFMLYSDAIMTKIKNLTLSLLRQHLNEC